MTQNGETRYATLPWRRKVIAGYYSNGLCHPITVLTDILPGLVQSQQHDDDGIDDDHSTRTITVPHRQSRYILYWSVKCIYKGCSVLAIISACVVYY